MRFLVLTSRRIESRRSGYDLRVANLCAHLPGVAHLVVAPYPGDHEPQHGLRIDGLFASIEELAPLRVEQRSAARHLRRSDDHFLAATRPVALAAARARLAEIVRERAITHVLVFGGEIAELAVGLPGVTPVPGPDPSIPSPRSALLSGPLPRTERPGPALVLDVCDSSSLTAARSVATGGRLGRLRDGLEIARKARTEARFLDRFDVVTAISDADARAVENGRRPGAVHTVPNGLDETYVRPLPAPGRRRGIVFWGNLDFGPNRDALRLLVDEIFLPHLRPHGVELCVAGPGAPPWLTALSAREPLVSVTGYVEDLPGLVDRYPIMVNPMCSGSGLKNKVLEAFGLGLAVVSTSMGVEAIPEVVAEPDRHLVRADAPHAVAQGVLTLLTEPALAASLRTAAHALVTEHYRWGPIARRWARVITAGSAGSGSTAGTGTGTARGSAVTGPATAPLPVGR